MIDALDSMLLNGASTLDDEDLSYHRVMGDPTSRVICFLPWRASLETARRMRIIPDSFLACYQLPMAIVSSAPQLCVKAMDVLLTDALDLIKRSNTPPQEFTIVGFSMGAAPATRLANLIGAQLCSVTSADRGDLMLWESPASVGVKTKAQQRGFDVADFTAALSGLHAMENLGCIRADSIFVTADRDLFVPIARRAALLSAVRRNVPNARIIHSKRGHVRTICATAQRLPLLLGGGHRQNAA